MHLTTIFVDLLQGNIVSIQQQTCIYPQNNNVKIYSVNIQISFMYFQICRLTPVLIWKVWAFLRLELVQKYVRYFCIWFGEWMLFMKIIFATIITKLVFHKNYADCCYWPWIISQKYCTQADHDCDCLEQLRNKFLGYLRLSPNIHYHYPFSFLHYWWQTHFN